jgi:hypothetical protein
MSDRKRVLRVHVAQPDKQKVNIAVPIGLARLAKLGGIGELLKARHDVDLDAILNEIDELPDGKVIDIVDEKTGDHVEIYIETVADRTVLAKP